MPKLVLMTGGKGGPEWLVQGREALIGRGPDCEVHLDDSSVSRHHAKLAKILTGYCIEDLKSTNGVILNGVRVRKHMLKDGDRMQIGIHELRFEAGAGDDTVDIGRTVDLSPKDAQRRRMAEPPPSERVGRAYVRFLTGPEQGNTKRIDRSLFTIGTPGGNLAVISRRARGHFLMHLGGDTDTTRNDEPVHGAGVELGSGDVIQVGEVRLEFYNEP